MGQRHSRECLGNMSAFGLRRPHEFLPNRRIVKQLADFDSRPDRAAAGLFGFAMSAIDPQFESAVLVGGPGANQRLTDFGDRGQASPRNPNVPTRNRSSASAILLVAWLVTASCSWSCGIPEPLSVTRISSSAALFD